jgi:hypothetical protein
MQLFMTLKIDAEDNIAFPWRQFHTQAIARLVSR